MAGVSKYGAGGLTTPGSSGLGLPTAIERDLMLTAGHSLSKKTWASYRTAERMLARYCKAVAAPMELPTSKQTIAGFVHWLIYVRNLKGDTVSGYLAGIRMLHIMKGLEAPDLRSDFIQLVLTGRKNQDAATRLRGGATSERQPVTPDILRLLKARIRETQHASTDKIVIWAVCTILFHGAFRGGELLANSTTTFDPAFTLLKKDIIFVEEGGRTSLQIKVKAPKEDKDKRAHIVDIFATGQDICPLRAAQKWEKVTRKWEKDQPAFRVGKGEPLTSNRLNKILKECLTGYIKDKIQVHSFRSGTASMMGTMGYADQELQAMGRWSSRAFETYVKLPRSRRMNVAKAVARKLEYWE